jgi:hypothetical protein
MGTGTTTTGIGTGASGFGVSLRGSSSVMVVQPTNDSMPVAISRLSSARPIRHPHV